MWFNNYHKKIQFAEYRHADISFLRTGCGDISGTSTRINFKIYL